MNISPWKDYAGNEIHEGDRIRHHSGEEGVVVFVPFGGKHGEKWFVDYENRESYSILSLQIGWKGKARVMRKEE